MSASASNLAVAAAREALARAQVNPLDVSVVIEYSILPQEYLVPVWNMSNKVQAEVGAVKSFVVGFSGGGASNFMVALSAAAAMLSENDSMKTALLVTGDATIPGNRVLSPADPVTVLGDGASAVVCNGTHLAAWWSTPSCGRTETITIFVTFPVARSFTRMTSPSIAWNWIELATTLFPRRKLCAA